MKPRFTMSFFVESDGNIIITHVSGPDCRPECTEELLIKLIDKNPDLFIGKVCGISYDDAPPDEEWISEHELVFCTTKKQNSISPLIPFPCPMFLRWPQVGIADAEQLMTDMLSESVPYNDNRIFWIGANTHHSRAQLCDLAKKHPDIIDAELMEWDFHAVEGQRSKTRQVSIPDHRNYKYLIDCSGYGYSARLKWLLATGRPVFVVDRDYIEFWHEKLVAWEHYIPVSRDFSDLIENFLKLESNPNLYDEIAANARKFAAENLNVDVCLNETMSTLENIIKLEKATPADPGNLISSKYPWTLAELLKLLIGFIGDNSEELWIISNMVFIDDDANDLFELIGSSDADFISLKIRKFNDDPNWTWWKSLSIPSDNKFDASNLSAAFMPLVCLSKRAAIAVYEAIKLGWRGHVEVLIPTIISHNNLVLKDLNDFHAKNDHHGIRFTYDSDTVDWRGPIQYKPGKIHHPVPPQTRALASQRIELSTLNEEQRILYVSPAGAQAQELLPDVLACFLGRGCDCLLLQYDETELALPEQVKVIRERGYKWQLALKHLHPDQLSEYDYIFFWDDDLGVEGFDPRTFVEIMRLNRLSMAQPAITSPHGLSHAITRYRPSPPPLRQPDGESFRPIVGRLTNFVEVMAPVFTREAWREFYSYLNPDNRSGWGYDYVPLGRKGIIDLMPVEHTRAVQSINGASEAELRDILDNQGLFRYQHVEMGWLLGHPSKFAFSQYASDVD